MLADEEFRRGAVATNFLGVRRDHLRFGDPDANPTDIASAAVWCATRCTGGNALWEDTRGWRLGSAGKFTPGRFAEGAASVDMIAPDDYSGAGTMISNRRVRVLARDAASLRVECDGASAASIRVFEAGARLHLFRDGRHVVLNRSAHRRCAAGRRRQQSRGPC